MPYDSELNRLESKLAELEEEIEAVNASVYLWETNEKLWNALRRTLNRLTGLKELAEMKIKVHRERVKESGVKY